ncbi:MAG: cell division protein FtsQ/DivIB [Rhizobiaceae bacterium]
MFALKPGRPGFAGPLAVLARAFAPGGEGLVLPRWLRRPARLASRYLDADYRPPRFAASIGAGAFLALSLGYGAWVGGHVPAVAQAVTSRLGFAVEHVEIAGDRETSEIDIIERLGLDGWTSLVGFDADAARARVASLPWIKSVSVRKTYPDTIEVSLVEKEPFALWQHGREIVVIGHGGDVIAPFTSSRHAGLPLLIGIGARARAKDFVGRVAAHPGLAARVKGYIRVAERRWDLRLENGITVRLPEAGEDVALAELLALDRKAGLLSRDIVAVDMRFSDRLVVQLTADAVERREAELKAQAKTASARKGKRI